MPTTLRLLERDEELATIESTLAAASQGDGGLVMIEGEAGAGKTALIDAAGTLAIDREMLVLRARGGEYERDFPYGVVRQLFEPLLAREPGGSELLGGRAAPAAPVFDPAAAPPQGPEPFDVQHGLYWLLAGLAESSPAVLLVDDAQWADLASLRALAYIGRRVRGLPAVLALSVRTGEPGEHEALLDELRRQPGGKLVLPPPLSAAATATLVANSADRQPSEGFAEACHRATAGNPFLLGELLQALSSEGTEPTNENAGRLADLAAGGVSRSVLARLARVGDDATDVARAVALLEPDAEARLVAALAGQPAEAVADACERLVVAGLLSDSRPVGFVHPLVRAAVLSDLPEPRRAADHARAARLLGEDGAGGDTVAAHLLLAEPAGEEWAVGELRAAAAASLGRGAPDGAVRYLRRALREPPPGGRRLEVSRELGMALLRADDPEGIEVLRAVRGALDDPVSRIEVANEISVSLALRRPGEEGARLLEESLAEVPEGRTDLRLQLRANLLLQVTCGLERVPDGMMPEPDEALAGQNLAERTVLAQLALIHGFGLGSVARARELAEAAVPSPAAVEADAFAGVPHHGALATLALADCGDRAEELFEVGLEASRRRSALPGVVMGHAVRAYTRLLDGELGRAWIDAEAAVRLVEEHGLQALRVQFTNTTAAALRVLIARGEYSAAEELLEGFWRGREPGPGIPGALLLVARGELRNATARHAEARHDFLAAAERVRWLPYANPEVLGWRTGLAQAEAALGNGEQARRLSAEALRLAREAGGRRGIGLALRVRGAVVDGADGIETLREAVEVLAETRARLQHAHALADLGAALRRANRRKEARGPLREALDLAHRCGAGALEERARTELAATGARPRKALLSGLEALTASELRVARLAADGMTNREIAQALTVTPKTVETHLRHVYQKLDVDRRTALAGALAVNNSDTG